VDFTGQYAESGSTVYTGITSEVRAREPGSGSLQYHWLE
jgi:hypothetical protein